MSCNKAHIYTILFNIHLQDRIKEILEGSISTERENLLKDSLTKLARKNADLRATKSDVDSLNKRVLTIQQQCKDELLLLEKRTENTKLEIVKQSAALKEEILNKDHEVKVLESKIRLKEQEVK